MMLHRLFDLATDGYVRVFGRPGLQSVNARILHMALRARGYNNLGSLEASGEALLIRRISSEPPALCIDVGANVGNYSRALLERTGAAVLAFEPQPGAFADLSALAARFPGRLTAVNAGVGDADGELELFHGSNSELASFCRDVHAIEYVAESNRNSCHVPVLTLDSYFAGPGHTLLQSGIALLKIDTEGYEYNVLRGAQATIRELRPSFIQVEFNWHQLFRRQSLHSLAELLPGYRTYQLLPRGFNAVDPRRPESNIYHYSNFVFVRAGIDP